MNKKLWGVHFPASPHAVLCNSSDHYLSELFIEISRSPNVSVGTLSLGGGGVGGEEREKGQNRRRVTRGSGA